jgi:Tat protein translocase TatB subunit
VNFGIGYSEIAVILLFALIVIGPRKLPQLMRDIGRVLGQLRRTADDLRREVMFSEEITEFRDAVKSVVDPPMPPAAPPKLKLKPESAPGGNGDPGGNGGEVPIAPVYQDPPATDDPLKDRAHDR